MRAGRVAQSVRYSRQALPARRSARRCSSRRRGHSRRSWLCPISGSADRPRCARAYPWWSRRRPAPRSSPSAMDRAPAPGLAPTKPRGSRRRQERRRRHSETCAPPSRLAMPGHAIHTTRVRKSGICYRDKGSLQQESAMAYTLAQFCADGRAVLKAEPLPDALARIAERLGRLLSNPAFVAESFSDDMPPGRRVLYRDAETGFHVLAHVQEGNKAGKPHSHGSSWAIYGNAREYTDMIEWRRTNPDNEKHAVLRAVGRYRLGPGETKAYGPGVIHSTAHPKQAWVIRVTGTDLDALPRYRFGKEDRLLEQA